MGTPDYMAPEQVKGKRGDARTDIYSLGAILYEMVTGQPPFEGTNPLAIMNARLMGDPIAPRKLNPNISPQVEEIILHAMEQRPENRYASAAAMKAELDAPDTGRADRPRRSLASAGPMDRIMASGADLGFRPDPDRRVRSCVHLLPLLLASLTRETASELDIKRHVKARLRFSHVLRPQAYKPVASSL